MKHFKRAAAMLLAVVLSLCLAVTAFAADTVQKTGTLTVTGSGLYVPGADGAAGEGKKVTAIRMFTARVTDDADDATTNTIDSYVLEEKWEAFFKQADVFQAMKGAGATTANAVTDLDSAALSDAAVAYINTLKNEKDTNKGTLADFAHKAQKWARVKANNDILTDAGLIKTETANTANDSSDVTKGTARFDGLTAGYYLVFPEGGSTGKDNRGTDAILVNVPRNGGNTAATIKSKFPTVEKQVSNNKIDYKDNTTAQVGDTVTFKLTAKVPDMTDYNNYQFIFHDTLSNGLSFDKNSVKVTVANAVVTKDTAYTVDEPSGTSKELTVKFGNLKNVAGADTGAEIVVTYTAKITKDAVKEKPAENSVYLEYSNDPSSDGLGKSNPDVSKVYTYQIDIDKFAVTTENTHKQLAGATFELRATADGTAIELVKESTQDNTLVYHIKGTDEIKETSVTKVTTPDTGKITIKGLNAGTYYLYETMAPTGYNKLKEPIKIVIAPDTGDLGKFTYTVNGKDNAKDDTTIKVENVKGIMLPETGSIGTIGLTVLGVAVVLLGVFAPRKKKKENQ